MKNRAFLLIGFLTIFYCHSNYSQCTVTVNPSTVNVTCGDSVNIVPGSQYNPGGFSNDFNNSMLPAGWTLAGTPEFTNPCSPSLDGSPTLWMGQNVSLPRVLTTPATDVSCGGQICFDFDFAADENLSGNCEDPDAANEGVYFRYSIDAGATWVDIFYFQPNNMSTGPYYSWANYCFPIPVGAQTSSTIFNFSQDVNSNATWDHWGIDNFSLVTNNCSSGAYYYLLDNSPFDGDTTVFSLTDEIYTIEFTNGIDDTCSTTLSTTVIPFDPNFVYDPDTVCTGEGLVWSPTYLGSTGGYFSATPAGIVIDSITGIIDNQSSLSGQYSVTYQSTNSSCPGSSSQFVQILDSPILFAGNDTMVQANTPFSLNAYNPTGVPIAWSGGITDGVPFSLPTGVYDFIVNTTIGCPSPDTIQVISGNPSSGTGCNLLVSPAYVTVDCGDSISIIASGQGYDLLVNENFNDSMLPPGWLLGGTPDFTNPCSSSLDGSPTVWMGSNVALPRILTTPAYDVSCGGQICFDLDFAADENNTDCEDPDAANEGVFLRYSTDGGGTWIDIFYFQPNHLDTGAYYSWANYCFSIPAGAQTSSTIFNISQDANSANNWDHWGIDNFSVQGSSCASGSFYYLLDNTQFDGDTTVYTAVDHVYIVEYTNGIDDTCSSFVNATVNSFNPSFNYDPDTVCTSQTINWSPLISGSSSGYFSASPSGLMLDSISGNIDYVNSISGQYTIQYQPTNSSCSGSSNQLIEIIDAPILFAGNDTTVESNVAFSLNAYNPSGASISWSGGITDGVPFSLPMGNYQYIVSLSNPVAGCPSSDTIEITVLDPPTISAIIVHDNGTSNGSIDATIVTYGGPVSSISWSNGATTEDITNLPAAQYTITVTDSSGMQGSETFEVMSSIGFNELENQGIIIYPNPSTSGFTIESPESFNVSIYDMTGKVVLNVAANNLLYIETKNWSKGMYLVEILKNDQLVTRKLMVE